MDSATIFGVLRPIILDVTGVPECIFDDPNAPAPSGPYAAVRPKQTVSKRGQANVNWSNATGPNVVVDVRAQIMVDCSVNFYRGTALDYASRLFQANKRPDVQRTLYQAGLGWNNAGPVNNLTALQGSQFEERAQITVRLMYETTDANEVNSIERIAVIAEDDDANEIERIDIDTGDAP